MKTPLRDDFYDKLVGLRAGEHYVYYTTRKKDPTSTEPIYRRDQWRFDTVMEAHEKGYGVPVQDLLGRFDTEGNPRGQYNYLFIRNGKR